MNSWGPFKLNSDLAGGGSVSNIGSDTAMGRRHLMARSLRGVRERVWGVGGGRKVRRALLLGDDKREKGHFRIDV